MVAIVTSLEMFFSSFVAFTCIVPSNKLANPDTHNMIDGKSSIYYELVMFSLLPSAIFKNISLSIIFSFFPLRNTSKMPQCETFCCFCSSMSLEMFTSHWKLSSIPHHSHASRNCSHFYFTFYHGRIIKRADWNFLTLKKTKWRTWYKRCKRETETDPFSERMHTTTISHTYIHANWMAIIAALAIRKRTERKRE